VADDEPGPARTASAPEAPPRPARRGRGIGPFSQRQVGLTFGLAIIAAALLIVITRPLGTTGPDILPDPLPTAFLIGEPEVGLRPGDRAPEFEVVREDGTTFGLTDLSGAPIRLADLRGKAVWVNFWATWCPPCQFETPILRESFEKYRDRGLVLVAVNVQETTDAASGYAARYRLRYPIGADVSGDIFHAYKVFALPTQFFIDPDGIIRAVVNGPLSLESAARHIEAILPK
jgi:peroxiredoxin